MYAGLAQSYQWNMMNQHNVVTSRIMQILKTGTQVKTSMIASDLNIIRNRLRSPLFNQILEALKYGETDSANGSIVLMFSNEIKIPIYLPFIILQTKPGTYGGVVFLNHCECVQNESEYVTNTKRLKVALESCYVALRFMQPDLVNSPKLTSPTIIRPSTKIYSHIMVECLNRKFNIKLDRTVCNQIMFMMSRYFITTVLGYHPSTDVLENYCMYECLTPDVGSIRLVNDQFTEDDFKDISTFLNKLVTIQELKGRLGKLTVSAFVEMYVNLYNAPMILAMEVFPYLFFNIVSVTQATYVNNYHMLKTIVGDDGMKLYSSIVTMLG